MSGWIFFLDKFMYVSGFNKIIFFLLINFVLNIFLNFCLFKEMF